MKKLLKLIGALVALLVVLALAAPLFISSDTLKAQLVAQVKKATGRTLEIKGATSVTFFPNIAVSAEDVTLSNPDGFTSPYFVSLKKLATGAELGPLLHGELKINGITLDGATINLEELKSGARNWEFTSEKLKDSAEKATDAPEAQKQAPATEKRFALGDISITDSAINYIKPGANVVALKNIDLTLQGADASAPLKLEGNADYHDEEVSLALDIAKTRDFMDGKFSPITASVKLPGASLDFNGKASMGDNINAQGKLDANAAALPKVLAWATGKKSSESLPQQVAVAGNVNYANKILKLSDATVRADSTKATGTLSVNHGGAVPKIGGSLDLGEVDLDALIKKSSGEATGGGGSGGNAEGWDSTPVDLSGLKAVDADLDLALTSLKSGKFKLGATQGHLALAGGKLALLIKQAQLYNGSMNGIVRASSGGIGADIKLNAIDIEALMVALSGKSRLEGKTNLSLNVDATGKSQREWVNTLKGNGALKVVDGALKGINIGSFLRNAQKGQFFKSDSESTDFSDLNATFSISNGVVSNSDLAMKSPALRLGGSGTVSLPSKSLNYKLMPTIAETSKGQGGKDQVAGLTVPLLVTGPWSNPSVTPDLAGMVQEGLKDPEALKQNLKNLKENYRNFNSPSDIGKALLGGGKTETAPTTATPPASDAAPATDAAPAPEEKPLSEKEQRQKAIEQGIGGLLKGL